ncbi:MAG: FecCD family ABC transporter permease [Candidatus Bathyarchaeia archaeon]|jgi:iron complex transport system permease protein
MSTDNVEAKYSKRAKRWKLILLGLIALLIVAIIICVNIGTAGISYSEILAIFGRQIPGISSLIDPSAIHGNNETIIMNIRLPRVIAGAVVGAGLAVAGVMYQGVFRNPMADSYLLGVSAGASFAYTLAALTIGTLGLAYLGLGVTQLIAFVGAVSVVFLVYSIARTGNKVPTTNLLLSGMVVSIFVLALQTVVELKLGKNDLMGIIAWTQGGGLTSITWSSVISVLPFVVVGIIIAYFFTKDLNMLAMGDDTAQNLGVNSERVRQILLLLASLVTAAVVSISGVIGFVGLIIPHMTRLIIGPDHRILLPTSTIVGAIFLIVCDSVARVATGASELPVGVYTAIAGTPFFIYLLRRRKTSYSM